MDVDPEQFEVLPIEASGVQIGQREGFGRGAGRGAGPGVGSAVIGCGSVMGGGIG